MAVDSASPKADLKYPETDNGVGVGRAPGVLRPGPQFQTRQAEQRAPGTAASFGVLISDSHSSWSDPLQCGNEWRKPLLVTIIYHSLNFPSRSHRTPDGWKFQVLTRRLEPSRISEVRVMLQKEHCLWTQSGIRIMIITYKTSLKLSGPLDIQL